MIRASLASIPEHERSLQQTVASLLPQVDRLGVYLNGYDSVPDFLHDPRIDVARSHEHGDRGDAGKMFWTDAGDFDYYFSCDDDLIYPPDYAERMVAAVEQYGRHALVGCHGALMRPHPADYYHSRARVYHCLGSVDETHSVHVIGTGAVAWHHSLGVSSDIFRAPNMGDIWLSAWANERNIPRIVIPHAKGWLRESEGTGHETIWDASSKHTGGPMDTSELQGRIARETPWRATPLPKTPHATHRERAVVSIITYDRADALLRLLDDVERERERFDGDLEVRIYDDASLGYEHVRNLCRERGYSYTVAPRHYGKAEHWRLVTKELADLRDIPADWYVFLPDDVRLCGDFFARAKAVWRTLEEPVALNLAHHLGRSGACWTNMEPRECGDGVEVGWIDGLYICRRELLERVGYRVPIPSERWVASWLERVGSSGVGKVMSEALVRSGARLYRVKRSLAQHQDVPSIMHTALRERDPQTALDPVEPFVPASGVADMWSPRPAPRLSIAMMAHPARAASVERILAALDRDVTVVWDEKQDRWDTGRRAWLAYDPDATHHAVIQDDVLVCRDLCAGLEQALAHVPSDAPLCAYIGRVQPYHKIIEDAVMDAGQRSASFCTMTSLCWGPLVVVPTTAIETMVAHGDTLTDVANYDRRLSRFWELERHIPVWYTLPSLVDHADGPSMVPGREVTNRSSSSARHNRVAWNFIGEDASALDVDWSGGVVTVGKLPHPLMPKRTRVWRAHPPIVVRR